MRILNTHKSFTHAFPIYLGGAKAETGEIVEYKMPSAIWRRQLKRAALKQTWMNEQVGSHRLWAHANGTNTLCYTTIFF